MISQNPSDTGLNSSKMKRIGQKFIRRSQGGKMEGEKGRMAHYLLTQLSSMGSQQGFFTLR
jgi:hypothetical protein